MHLLTPSSSSILLPPRPTPPGNHKSTFNFNVFSDLNNFCPCNDKWYEIPYAQAVFTLSSHPSLCSSCSTFQILLLHPQKFPLILISPPLILQIIMLCSTNLSMPPALPPTQNPPPPTKLSSASPNPKPDTDPNFSPPRTHSWVQIPASQNTSQLAHFVPLGDTAGTEGIVWVHVPNSLSNPS